MDTEFKTEVALLGKNLSPPAIPKNVDQLEVMERTATVLGYSIRRLEFWVSPNGRLREWCRINVAIGLILLVPGLTVLPAAVLVFGGLATFTGYMATIAANLLSVCLSLTLTIGIISGFVLLVRHLRGRK
jgi:hypothetical protein